MKLNDLKLPIILSGIVLGFLLSTQLNFKGTTVRENLTLQNYQQMVYDINKLKDEISSLKEQQYSLELKAQQYSIYGKSESEMIKKLSEEIETINSYTGLTPVVGHGVTITLADSLNISSMLNVDGYIHDSDVLRIISDLKNAGAEAISVNGERVIYSSSIYCGGQIIFINGKKFPPPYIIKAIGNMEKLEDALISDESYYRELQDFELQVSYEKDDSVEIPAYKKSISFSYLKPYVE